MSLLADTFFPITHFPVWAQRVALALPLTHGMAVARPLWLGQWDNMFLLHILYLIILSQLLTNWAINQTRRRLIY
jgi:lipooligosaccharide transport system permease protein